MVDTTAPTLASVAITGNNTIELTISELLDETVATTTGFAVSDNSIDGDPVISGSTITITVDTAITPGNILTVSYFGGSTITDLVGNALTTFALQSVTSSVLDNAAPTVLISSTVADDGPPHDLQDHIIYCSL